jgi:nicotinamidase-related amidase
MRSPTFGTVPLDLAEMLHPSHTALVTMELQRGVVGDLATIPDLAAEVAARGVLANAGTLCRAGRSAGVRIVHCTAEFRTDRAGSNENSPMLRRIATGPPHLLVGSPSTEIVPELDPQPSDVISPRVHGLTPFPNTELDSILRNLDVRTVVAIGVSLNLGVAGLVLVAVDLGYRVAIVTDAVAGVPADYGDEMIEYTFAPLAARVTTAEVVRTWEAVS